jgi:uncharacterized membrane protein
MTVMGRRQRSTSELLRTRGSRNVNDEEREHLTSSQRAGDLAAAVLGSWTFLVVVALALLAAAFAPLWGEAVLPAGWLVPALLGLVFVQTSVLLISWNRQMAKDRLKANLAYQFNLKTEISFAQLKEDLDRISERLRALVSGSEADEALGRTNRPPPA